MIKDIPFWKNMNEDISPWRIEIEIERFEEMVEKSKEISLRFWEEGNMGMMWFCEFEELEYKRVVDYCKALLNLNDKFRKIEQKYKN